jgi:hypothetical protein
VPYTEAALRRVDRYLGVEKGGGADQFRARQGMITTQGCVTDGMCVLDPLVVVAPPPEPSDLLPCAGCEAPFLVRRGQAAGTVEELAGVGALAARIRRSGSRSQTTKPQIASIFRTVISENPRLRNCRK